LSQFAWWNEEKLQGGYQVKSKQQNKEEDEKKQENEGKSIRMPRLRGRNGIRKTLNMRSIRRLKRQAK
jgi:hypothetical protein